MTTRYEYIEPPRDPKAATEFLAKNFLPLFDEFWEAQGREYYKQQNWDINALEFTRIWMDQTLVLLLAYEGDKSVGFILAAQLRPLLYDRGLLRIEQIYGQTPEIVSGLMEYLKTCIKFFRVGEVIVPSVPGVPAEWQGFDEVIDRTERRFVRV